MLDLGAFPVSWKEAVVSILSLKKLSRLGINSVFKNLLPVSNFTYITVVRLQSVLYFVRHTVPATSSGQVFIRCCNLYIVDTTVPRQRKPEVANDILLNMNSKLVTLLVLLDLSAALDTVDHGILRRRLNTSLGVRGKALQWFIRLGLS